MQNKASRLALLRRILVNYNLRADDLVRAVSEEMGAPLAFARDAHVMLCTVLLCKLPSHTNFSVQVWAGRVQLEATIASLETYEFEHLRGSTMISKEVFLTIHVCHVTILTFV